MFRSKWVLVTGAGSGIGRATALLLAEQGARLVLADCHAERLAQVAADLTAGGAEVHAFVVDVADRTRMVEFAAWVHERTPALDLLINNAGVLVAGGYEASSLVDYDRVLAVNVLGAVHAVQLFVPRMRQAKRGAVVQVASASGLVGFSLLNAYSTSKFALVGFSAALGAELGPDGISVTCVCPGLVQTSLAEGLELEPHERARLEHALLHRGLAPEAVARAILRGVARRQSLVLVGRQARLLSWLSRLFPSRASLWLTRLSQSA